MLLADWQLLQEGRRPAPIDHLRSIESMKHPIHRVHSFEQVGTYVLAVRNRGLAFTILELLVVLAIVTVLASLMAPALFKARERSKRALCLSNAKQLATATLMYAEEDTKRCLTPHVYTLWPVFSHNWLWRYTGGSPQVFFCPSTRNGIRGPLRIEKSGTKFYDDLIGSAQDRKALRGYSYDVLPFFADMEEFWNGVKGFVNISRAVPKTLNNLGVYRHQHHAFGFRDRCASPAEVWLYTDSDSAFFARSFYPDPENNHGIEGCNVSFSDGHAQWVSREQVVLAHELSQDNNRTRNYPQSLSAPP